MTGMTLECFVYNFGTEMVDSSLKWLSLSFLHGQLVARFFNYTGGLFNFWNVLAFQVVLGTWQWHTIGASFLASLAAPIFVLLTRWMWGLAR